jgi:hypothetical protein
MYISSPYEDVGTGVGVDCMDSPIFGPGVATFASSHSLIVFKSYAVCLNALIKRCWPHSPHIIFNGTTYSTGVDVGVGVFVGVAVGVFVGVKVGVTVGVCVGVGVGVTVGVSVGVLVGVMVGVTVGVFVGVGVGVAVHCAHSPQLATSTSPSKQAPPSII